LTHIGVLEWLEANRVPVDYVAGTSMGGLIGGLYATGKSPAELRELIREMDWDLLLGGSIPYRNLAFRRREDRRAYPNSIVIGLRGGARLPPGLNTGHHIALLLDRETLAYSDLGSFDDLPTPFRSVATDLVTGEARVFANGRLADALHATMSSPGIFAPVRSSGQIYADGGLVNNLPTDVVRAMGADVVIAVHLREEPAGAERIRSLLDVLGRSVDLVVSASEARGLAAADLVVSVDVADLVSAGYAEGLKLIARGTEAAAFMAPRLQAFALGEAAWMEHMKARAGRRRRAAAVPQYVRVEGTDPRTARYLERSLARFAGMDVDSDRLDRELTRLSGMGRFSRVGYRIVREGGRAGLVVVVEESDFGPPVMQTGVEVDGTDAGNVGFTLGARLTAMDVAGYRSEWRTDVVFGSAYGIRSELYVPWTGSSDGFLAAEAGARRSSFEIYQQDDPLAEYRVDRAWAAVDLGSGFTQFAEVRLGYEIGYLDTALRLGNPELSQVAGGVRAVRFRFAYDRTDDPVIPRRGAAVETAVRWYDRSPGTARGFPAATMRLSGYQPITPASSVFLLAEGGTTFGERDTGTDQFALGGPQGLSAYGSNELRGNQYLLLRGGYLRDLWRLPPFLGKKVYAVGQVEVGRMYAGVRSATASPVGGSRWPRDVAVGLVARTVFGPLLIGGSVGNDGHARWFFKIGSVF
jgi:NTE family protein